MDQGRRGWPKPRQVTISPGAKLQAVGVDVDGRIKPIGELSYTPPHTRATVASIGSGAQRRNSGD